MEIYGEAEIAKIFSVTDTSKKKGGGKKQIQVAGSRVMDGELNKYQNFRIMRGGMCIADGLTIHTMKKFKNDVEKVELGNECGLAFNGLKSIML